ncbi:MAG: acyltransferase family protein [Pyrinomonadaceae bacterium]
MASVQELPSPLAAQTQTPVQVVQRARFYHPEMDVLRFFAFFLVYIYHTLPRDAQVYLNQGGSVEAAAWASAVVSAGALGVDLFFVLSAYLITELFIREFNNYGRVNVRAFYIRRILRIWPLYYGFLALIVILIPVSLSGYLDWKYKTTFLLLAANWACALWGFPPSVASHLWSVAIEEQFYLMWPLVITAFGIKRIGHVALAMLLIATSARLLLIFMGVVQPGIWCNTFARLDPLACGALIAVYLRGGAPRLNAFKRFAMFFAGLLLYITASRYAQAWGATSLLYYPAAAAGSTLILLACLSRAYTGQSRVSRTLIYLGRISYGLYVFHLLGLSLAGRLSFGSKGLNRLVTEFILGAILTLILSIVSYEWFEKRFLRWKEKFTRIPSRPA